MQITRRSILSVVGAAVVAPSAFADTPSAGPAFGQRSIGSPTAPVTVIECFSLTCSHCAYFGTTVMPQVKPKLVDTGKVRIVYQDFPLDQVALMAAQVARTLPAEQYYPFIEALFASQNDWAFTPGIDYKESIFKYAALAGMDRTTYDGALANDKLKQFILSEQQTAEKMYNVDATPTFIISGKAIPGAMEYDDFAAKVAAATPSAKGT